MWFLYAILAAVVSSGSALLEKKTLLKEHAVEFATALAVAVCIVGIPFLPKVRFSSISSHGFLLIYLVSLFAAIAYILVTKAVRHLDISLVSPFLLLGPVITVFFAYVVLHEAVTPLQALGVFFVLVPIFLLEYSTATKQVKIHKYFWFVFLALVLYGVTSVLDKTIIARLHVPVLSYLVVLQLFLMVNMCLILIIYRGGRSRGFLETCRRSWRYIVIIALCTWSYRYLQFQSFALAAVGLSSTIRHSSSLLTTMAGGTFFREEHLLKRILYCTVILLGVVLIIL